LAEGGGGVSHLGPETVAPRWVLLSKIDQEEVSPWNERGASLSWPQTRIRLSEEGW